MSLRYITSKPETAFSAAVGARAALVTDRAVQGLLGLGRPATVVRVSGSGCDGGAGPAIVAPAFDVTAWLSRVLIGFPGLVGKG
jgi:hypothetical protein